MTKPSERISPAMPQPDSFHEGTFVVTLGWSGRPLSDGTWGDQQAPCYVDPELFFEGSAGSLKRARQVCLRECPIRTECAVYALDRDERVGAWGGMGMATRRRFRALWTLLMYPARNGEPMIQAAQTAARGRFNDDPRAPLEIRLHEAVVGYRQELARVGVLAAPDHWDDGQIAGFSRALATIASEATGNRRTEFRADRILTNAETLRRAYVAITEHQDKIGERGAAWVSAQRIYHVLAVRVAARRAFRAEATPP